MHFRVKTAFNCITNQRGALFGLDARIAIAVFTLLSSISGYLVFSKVEKARNTSLIKELEIMSHAFNQMQVDLRTFLPFALKAGSPQSDFSTLWDSSALKPNYQNYWNGPYYTKHSTNHDRYGQLGLIYLDDDNAPCSRESKECSGYITVSDVPQTVWRIVNEYKDESLGHALEPLGNEHLEGTVRASHGGDPTTLYYKAFTRKQRGQVQ